MTKRQTVTYLFADGHAVQLFEKQDKDCGSICFAEVFEKFTDATLAFEGRIVIGRYSGGLAHLLKSAESIRAAEPKIDAGSQGTREKGIPFGTLEVGTKHGSLYFHDMPGTISGPYHYQPENGETFDAGIARWSDYPVARVHRVKQATVLAMAGGAK